MPGWHDSTKQLQDAGEFQMLGLIQEQHPDRCRLFMQWKEMDWPIMVDSLDLLGVTVVPITVLIDEAGIVRKVRARPDDLSAFLDRPPVAFDEVAEARPPNLDNLGSRAATGGAVDLRHYADALFMWGGPERLDDAIAAYERSLAQADDAATHFHMGVALQNRFERKNISADFAAAVERWSKALAMNPNQYIWRRRIQQYGPRLDKPYSFYDWVFEAREAIAARGQTPSPLRVEPRGAELAYPYASRRFADDDANRSDPDPQGRINRDAQSLIQIDTVVVPTTQRDGGSARVHVLLTPNESLNAHWNNESDETEVWLSPPPGWRVNALRQTAPNGSGAVSTEPRRVEFEILPPDDASPGVHVLSGYALYYVCEDADGLCLYLRRDIEIPITVR